MNYFYFEINTTLFFIDQCNMSASKLIYDLFQTANLHMAGFKGFEFLAFLVITKPLYKEIHYLIINTWSKLGNSIVPHSLEVYCHLS
jgi:hypothetical protein